MLLCIAAIKAYLIYCKHMKIQMLKYENDEDDADFDDDSEKKN